MKRSNNSIENFQNGLLATAIAGALSIGVPASSAEAAALSSLITTSGSVDMGAYTPTPNVFTHFSGANLIGGFQSATWDIHVPQTGPAPGAVIAWDFNGGGTWGNMYTTASPPTPLGSAPVPTGDVTGTVLTLDLRALTRNWNGEHQTWGIDNITGTASGGDSGTFTATWTVAQEGGAFDGIPATLTLGGIYQVVPVPATAWLLGSGLVGLTVAARRRPVRALRESATACARPSELNRGR